MTREEMLNNIEWRASRIQNDNDPESESLPSEVVELADLVVCLVQVLRREGGAV